MTDFRIITLWTLFLMWLFQETLCHPQCLDFRAPFKPRNPLSFCSQYSDLGCCGQENDNTLLHEYYYVQSKVSSGDWDRCHGYIKQILCQKCSPYAAHIYDAELTAKPRSFPGLCKDYCGTIYDQCSSLMGLLDSTVAFRNAMASRERFCGQVSLNDVDYCYPDLLSNPLLNRNLTQQLVSFSSDGCLCLETVKDKLANPLWARHAGDGSSRLFVALQKGRVYIYNTKTKQWSKQTFLDLSSDLVLSSFPGDERGFLGLAFHPNYTNNGRFFVYYSTRREPGDVIPPELEDKQGSYDFKIRISEMKVMADNPNRADTRTEKVVIELLQPYSNHNGGELFFGVDGYLYAFIGDGGAAGDRLDAGQDKSLLFGKAIRLDVDSNSSLPYSIPPDNPFVHEAGARPEIYAYGIRNIWRCGMDRGDRVTGANRGRVLCGDVGQNAFEEIDLLQKGANYGWKAKEGFECYNRELCETIVNDTLPVWAYPHSVGKSVTGGVFYRGCENPALNGQYIYGDYVSSRLFSLNESGGTWTNRDVSLCGSDLCQGNLKGSLSDFILSFGEDEDGEIYILTSTTSRSSTCDGTVYKIVDPRTRNDPTTCDADLTKDDRVRLPSRRTTTTTTTTTTKTGKGDKTRNGVNGKKHRRRPRKRLRRRRKHSRRNRKSKRLRRKGRKRSKKLKGNKKQRKNRKNRKLRRRQRKKAKSDEDC